MLLGIVNCLLVDRGDPDENFEYQDAGLHVFYKKNVGVCVCCLLVDR
jgi:hypothetical protein